MPARITDADGTVPVSCLFPRCVIDGTGWRVGGSAGIPGARHGGGVEDRGGKLPGLHRRRRKR